MLRVTPGICTAAGAAGEVLLYVHRNHPLIRPRGASSLNINILVQRSIPGKDANGKEIYCMWSWWIASYFTQLYSTLKGWLLFFTHESARSLTLPLTILLSPMPDTISDAQSPRSPLGYWQDSGLVFSLWNREVNSELGQLGCSCQFHFIISSTQLDVWNSQTLGENHVCLNFKNRLLAGNEYPATVAQLCLSESKSNPRGC